MKKNNDVSLGKRISHFFRHYSGYVLLALFCAVITVILIGFCGA